MKEWRFLGFLILILMWLRFLAFWVIKGHRLITNSRFNIFYFCWFWFLVLVDGNVRIVNQTIFNLTSKEDVKWTNVFLIFFSVEENWGRQLSLSRISCKEKGLDFAISFSLLCNNLGTLFWKRHFVWFPCPNLCLQSGWDIAESRFFVRDI